MTKKVIICTLPDGSIVKYHVELMQNLKNDYLLAVGRGLLIQDGHASASDLSMIHIEVIAETELQ